MKELLLNVLMIHKPSNHLWYIRMIVLYYLAMPLISYVMKNCKSLLYIIISLVLCYFLYNGYRIFNGINFPSTSGVSYGCYILYILGGYYISQNNFLERAKSIYIYILSMMLLVVLFYTVKQYDYFLWYDNPFILLFSYSLFVLFYRWTKDLRIKYSNWITELSIMTFGIYLIHMIFIIPVNRHALEYVENCNTNALVYILTVVAFVCSVLAIRLIKKWNSKFSYWLFRY